MVPPQVTASRCAPRPAGEHAGHAVPDDARAQLGELVAGVAPGEHVEHRLEDRARQRGERRRPADHATRGRRPPSRPWRTSPRSAGRGRRRGLAGTRSDSIAPARIRSTTTAVCDEVAAELREQHAPRHRADLVAGAADPLQPAGHARRRLDLDDEVDRAHVDAELERARRDHRGQPPGLEVLLDELAVLLAHRAVVGAGQHGGGARAEAPDCAMICGRGAGCRGCRAVASCGQRRRPRLARIGLEALLPDLVEPGGQPLGEAARVGEHQRRAVRGDEVDDALLDVRPDRGPALGAGRGPGQVASVTSPSADMSAIGHDDLEVPLLGRRRPHDLDRSRRRRGSARPRRPARRWRTARCAGPAARAARRAARGRAPGGRRAWCRRPRAPRRG